MGKRALTDEEIIGQAVADAKGDGAYYSVSFLAEALLGDRDLAYAVARFLLQRDTDCKRVPLIGSVT